MGGGLGLVVRVDRDPVDLGCGSLRAWGFPGMAVRGRRFRGCCVTWLIGGLLGLAFLSGLVVFIRKRRARPTADDTLVADLLGPPEQPEVPVPRTWDDGPRSPAPQAQQDGQPARAPRVRKNRWPPRASGRPPPNPPAREDGQPSRAPERPSPAPGRPSRAPDHPSPASSQSSPDSQAREDGPPSPVPSAPPAAAQDWLETQLAWINAWSQRMKEQITSAEQPGHAKE
jgi:hypothetical protein